MFQPVVKWIGSKRSQSSEILKYFPKEIDTYIEPFCGSCSMMRALLESDIKVNKIICNDISEPLINLWNYIKLNPNDLCEFYKQEHGKFLKDKKYYYDVRNRFNKKNDCRDFLFLLRTCANGMPRWNKSGEFNTSLHLGRNGIKPETFYNICMEWSEILNEYNVQFINTSYEYIKSKENDFMYLDPPYANIKGLYYGCIDYGKLWNWIRNLKCNYILSFDGKTSNGDDFTYSVPKDIYKSHKYIKNCNSSFRRLTNTSNDTIVYESLYIK